jgi:hypothetical protein
MISATFPAGLLPASHSCFWLACANVGSAPGSLYERIIRLAGGRVNALAKLKCALPGRQALYSAPGQRSQC